MISKAYIVVFFVALTIANSLGKDYFPWKFGTCILPKLGDRLDPEKFFKDRWYVAKSVGNYLFQVHGKCMASEFQLKDNGKVDLLTYQYEPLFGKYSYFRGTAESKFAKFKGAFVPVSYEALGGLYHFEIPFAVIDTDYDNWSLVYFCKQFLGFKAEMAWMLARKRNVTLEEIKDMEVATTNLGLDYTSFVDQDNSNCPKGEPEL